MAKFNRKLQVTVRPQKRPNLPKAAVNILTRWLEENCTNPYPSESTKKILMEVTNLTKNQIYNWFINSRRRILPNILKEKDIDKSLILLKIKKFTCFTRNSFAHHFEKKTQCIPDDEILEVSSISVNPQSKKLTQCIAVLVFYSSKYLYLQISKVKSILSDDTFQSIFLSKATKKLIESETIIEPKNEDYNLQLLAEVATKLPRITCTS